MKKTKISTIAAAALMTVFMLSGCGKDAADITRSNDASTSAATASAPETPAPDSANVQESAASDESKAEDAADSSEEKKDDAKPAETKAPETKVPDQTQAPADAAETMAAVTEAPKAETKAPEVTIPEFTPVNVSNDPYAGSYAEQTAGRATMEITNIGNNNYSVHISWPVTNNEINTWDLTGEFDGKGNLRYYNCRKVTSAYDSNGNYTVGTDGLQTPFTTYTAGSGIIKRTDNGIEWTDDMGDIIAGTTFRSVNAVQTAVTDNGGSTASDPDAVANALPYGTFYDGNGSKTWLDISEFSGTRHCIVSAQDGMGRMNTWTFTGDPDANGRLSYYDGWLSTITYNTDGSIESNETVSKGHSGTLEMSNTGIVWKDSDGTQYVFINDSLAPAV